MIFLSPRSDIAFKKLFGNEQKKEITISFLNSVLDRKEGEKITNLTFNDPYNDPDAEWAKMSIVDVSCTDQQGKKYIVEMQVIHQKDYAQRCQYYASLAIARQLKQAQIYETLTPVIFVGVVDFELFKIKHYLSHYFLLESATLEHGLDLLEFHFIELPKFHKTLEILETIVDKWVYLLKNAEDLKEVPQIFKNQEEFKEAMFTLNQGTWSQEELAQYDYQADRERVYKSQIETALADGELKSKLAIAQAMLKKELRNSLIAEITGLSIEQIDKLKK